MEKRTKIGSSKIADHPDAKIIFYISAMDDSGREDFVGHTKSEKKIMKLWEEMKIDNYDMHLYIALAKEHLIDDEVIDSFVLEDN